MSKRNRSDPTVTHAPESEPERPASHLPAGASWGATAAALVVLLLFGYINGRETRELRKSVDYRLDQIDTRLSQLSAKVDKVGEQAASARRGSGPDPNRVYAIKTEGAPVEGPLAAPITIAEFSDFQ
jgi:hypothetical protein